jgi:hypothetical protein
LFLQYFVKILDASGRAGIVIENTFLSNTDKHDPFFHLSTAADALCRSPQTIGRWGVDGRLPSVIMPNGMRKIRKCQHVQWLEVTRFGEDDGALDLVET